jgi:hypothetical protein
VSDCENPDCPVCKMVGLVEELKVLGYSPDEILTLSRGCTVLVYGIDIELVNDGSEEGRIVH